MGRRRGKTVRRQTEAVVLDWNWECWDVCHSTTLSSKHLDKCRVLRKVSKRLMQGDVNDDM